MNCGHKTLQPGYILHSERFYGCSTLPKNYDHSNISRAFNEQENAYFARKNNTDSCGILNGAKSTSIFSGKAAVTSINHFFCLESLTVTEKLEVTLNAKLVSMKKPELKLCCWDKSSEL